MTVVLSIGSGIFWAPVYAALAVVVSVSVGVAGMVLWALLAEAVRGIWKALGETWREVKETFRLLVRNPAKNQDDTLSREG